MGALAGELLRIGSEPLMMMHLQNGNERHDIWRASNNGHLATGFLVERGRWVFPDRDWVFERPGPPSGASDS